jgi:ketosteroid isomerase-like protein
MPEHAATPDLSTLVQRVTDAVNARDLDAQMSFFAPDAVYDLSPMGMDVLEGRAAIRAFAKEWESVYEDYAFEAEAIHDLGNGVALTIHKTRGRLHESVAWLEFRYASVAIWTDGLVEWNGNYADLDEGRRVAERLAKEQR